MTNTLTNKIQLFLLEADHFGPDWVDYAAEVISKNYIFVKRTALDLSEANIRGRGNIFAMVMKMAVQNRIAYEESEVISAFISERLSDIVEGFNLGTI